MKDKIEALALKAFIGVTLATIVGLASVQVWAMGKAALLEEKKNG